MLGAARVREGRMGRVLVHRAQYRFGTVAPDRQADALQQANKTWGGQGTALTLAELHVCVLKIMV